MEIQQMLELLLANQKKAEADKDELKANVDNNQGRMAKFEEKIEENMERQMKHLTMAKWNTH
jgi:phosphoglycerate-specific signal transduction histidine kinase